MFEFVFLGTSASAPSVHRGLSAHVVMHRDHRFLIDCGEGTQRQILRSGLGFKRLQKILITHGHLDHILGLGGLLSTLTRWEAIEHVEIWAGQRALRRIRDLVFGVVFRGEREQLRIEFKEIVPGAIIADGNSFELMAFPVTHRGGQCFGFVFQEKPRRPFLEEKAVELGVRNGPERRDLVQGRTITLPEGKIVHPDDVLGPVEAGTKLVHVGDAGETDDILEHCRDADALVVEATYLHSELDLARRFGHLTALQAAELAQDANVRSLYLTHLSRRYRERDVTAEAQSVFANTVVARDLDHIEVRR